MEKGAKMDHFTPFVSHAAAQLCDEMHHSACINSAMLFALGNVAAIKPVPARPRTNCPTLLRLQSRSGSDSGPHLRRGTMGRGGRMGFIGTRYNDFEPKPERGVHDDI